MMKPSKLTRRKATALIAATFGYGLFSDSLWGQTVNPLVPWKVGRSLRAFRSMEEMQLEASKEAGFECLELSVTGVNADQWSWQQQLEWLAQFKENVDRVGLTVRSIHIPFGRRWDISDLDDKVRAGAIEGCARYFELKDLFGAKIFVLHPSYEPIKTEDRLQRIENCIDSLKQLAPIAKAKGVCVAVEDLPRTCLANTAEETIRLVDAAGDPESIRVCFDSNHLLKETPESFVEKVGKRIVTVHMSDYDGIDEKHWLPFEGVIDWQAVIAALLKTSYPGPFVFETERFKDRIASPKEIYATWLRVKEKFAT